MTHGKHVFHTASDMAMATMCEYLSSIYALPHWKCVLCYCAQCPQINIPSTESDQHNSNVIPIMQLHCYQHIARCNVRVRRPFNEKKQFQLCEASTDIIVTAKLYPRKQLVIMESSIVDFNQDFYIPVIKELEFHIPHVRILGMNHCGNT